MLTPPYHLLAPPFPRTLTGGLFSHSSSDAPSLTASPPQPTAWSQQRPGLGGGSGGVGGGGGAPFPLDPGSASASTLNLTPGSHTSSSEPSQCAVHPSGSHAPMARAAADNSHQHLPCDGTHVDFDQMFESYVDGLASRFRASNNAAQQPGMYVLLLPACPFAVATVCVRQEGR